MSNKVVAKIGRLKLTVAVGGCKKEMVWVISREPWAWSARAPPGIIIGVVK